VKGSQIDYTVRRLLRDVPEIAAEVQAGTNIGHDHEKMIFDGICPPQFRRVFDRFITTLYKNVLMSVKMFAPSFGPWVDVNFENYEQQKERLRILEEQDTGYWDRPESNARLDPDAELEMLDLQSAIAIFERVHLNIAA
jgi:hypothetical protein